MKALYHSRLRIYAWALLIFLIGNLSACSNAPARFVATRSLIRVAMDNNYPPYAFTNEAGEMQGILIDQWKLWEQRTGVQAQVVGLPWEQALSGMERGEFDVIDTIFYTEERARLFDFTKPYADVDVNIFFPATVSGIANVDSLQGFHVAVKAGDANVEYLTARGIADLIYYDSYEDIIRAAADKSETIFVIDQPPALYFLYKYDIQDQFDHSEPLYGGQFHRAVKKGDADTLALVNFGFEHISAAEYEQINDRWFGTNRKTDLLWIMPYAVTVAAGVFLVIAALTLFNRILQARVKQRAQELEETLVSLKASESHFRELLEFLPIAIGIADSAGRVLSYNRKFTEQYGYAPEDTTNIEAWMERVYPDAEYREQVNAQWSADVAKAIREQSVTPQREYRIVDKYGKAHDVEIIMRPVGDLWITSFNEITERKRAEDALREAEAKYRALVESAPEVIYLDKADDASACVYISGQVERLLGYSTADFSQNPKLWHDLIYPEDYQRALFSIQRTLFYGGAVEEYRVIKRDGSVIWVRDTSVTISDKDGKVVFVQGFLQDVTERKKVEDKLQESEARYRAFFEDSPLPLLEEDFSAVKIYFDELEQSGVEDFSAYFKENPQAVKRCAELARVVDVNKAALRWRQTSSKPSLFGNLSELLPENGYESFVEEALALRKNGSCYENTVTRRDANGDMQHLIVSGRVAPNYEYTWERVLVSIVDVTQRKQAEDDLAKQLERLRSLRAIDQSIIANLDLSENLDVLIREIAAQLRVDAVSIALLKGQTLQFSAGQGFQTDLLKFVSLDIGEGLAGRVARERDTVYIRNLQEADYHPTLARAIQSEGFLVYYGVPLIAKGKLLGVLEIFNRSLLDYNADWLIFLQTLAGQAAISIDSAVSFKELKLSNIELELAYDNTLEGWSRALDLRDKETEGHTRRVTELTLKLARHLGFSAEQMIQIKRGSILHDIGKMGIPDAILLKPGPLNDEEWAIMRKHPSYAHEMLAPIKYLEAALDIPIYHHERWDGSGYPNGLAGQEIPLAARIFAVVDVWDALTSNRPYRAAWDKERVREYIRERAGKQFDRRIVEAFLAMLERGDL